MSARNMNTLLIANRGEIACRIMRTAQRMGIRCIAVYSEADRLAPHVKAADAAYCIGPAPASESYLRVDKILAVAREAGADAIHPGYGFLSENTELASACDEAGIIFVGPPANAIRDMGSKSAAKALMAQARVPLVPGYHGEDQSPALLCKEAEKIGFPVLVKASAGGGGKGMRVVWEAGELDENIAAAQREAQSSFGDSRLLLEKYVLQPRHVEVQILFDQHGKGVYLFDRDCSLQRRHQKIIEEAPAPGLSAELRTQMGEAALRCGEATGYVGAGTVEFLLDKDHNFYFMEMNTRLQVEHPVTEAVTGLDLVEWQLRVAQGEALPWSQAQLQCSGHAMEARLYAEDPDRDFLPTSGFIDHLQMPEGEKVRVDSGIEQGLAVGSHYDPMLAKIIAWGDTRNEARRNLIAALASTELVGFTTNLPFLSRALKTPAFAAGELSTDFVDLHAEDLQRESLDAEHQAVLTWLLWFVDYQKRSASADPWTSAPGWRLAVPDDQQCEVRVGERELRLRYRLLAGDRAELMGEQNYQLQWTPGNGHIEVRLAGERLRVSGYSDSTVWTVFSGGETWQARINHPELTEAAEDEHALTAPMHGRVTTVLCQTGDAVSAGQPLVVMEAMKMEHTIKAPADGVVVAVLCEEHENVSADQPLVEFEATGDSD
ncbi:acetyl/propionyl/methylcrotonyl-CoA carboxylase subunit alpha [Gilvimarinus sp. F26214L]|uniref:acetyl/propionyl/methylcrotonyl-CoA carboxylase subunit alpha n=1 Tax=Gilvimarinus sp. DZF01 TaxID=3461371 RepID=UPI004045D07A